MKSFLSACAAVFVLAVGSWFVLERFQESSTQAYTTTGARI
jgi:hypothetical protein